MIELTLSPTDRSSSAIMDCCRLSGFIDVKLLGAEPVVGVETVDETFTLFSKQLFSSEMIKSSSSVVGKSIIVMVISCRVGFVKRRWIVKESFEPKTYGGALIKRTSGMCALAYNWIRYLIDGGLNSGFKTLCWHCLHRSDRLIEMLLCCGYKLFTERGCSAGFCIRCLSVVTAFKLIGCVKISLGNWSTSSVASAGMMVGFFFTVNLSVQPIWRRMADAVKPVRSCNEQI